jgi:predicted RND superfamily exporter protein
MGKAVFSKSLSAVTELSLITLAIGVATWVFSPLKFQADIGIMLTFMFLVNMIAAIILLPALAAWFCARGQ